ncbi:TlpA family protein disulfide reductase [Tenacibaculum aquimarinum]|uniref:TlpA family protein disulfide reductase n=1 Tax=Tenacibaculum aquimarinum TaxID=2910675 RepID=UPI001F0A16E5|nr:TlpA disulfide reductase family protein [Tenacibaculum aquimarinum]MCH3883537.1 TlpA family protein disulfide reductase [Tenacibaculum aquimarinum]
MKRIFLLFCFLWMSAIIVAQEENFKVGDSIPNFKLWLTDGTRLTQEDIKDKVVVFKFWFTACLPCVIDIPPLNELVIQMEARDDILFVAPALDRKEPIFEFLDKHPFVFKIAYSSMDVSEVFNKKQVYPSYFVIDKKGKFAYVDSGSKQSHFMPLKKAILKALEE